MNLGELIKRLEKESPTKRLKHGFHDPHSWRGSYCELGFVRTTNITVGEMLADAKIALGNTYGGWKGGEYTMHEYTEVYLVDGIGDCGSFSDDGLPAMLLEYMLGDETQ